MHGDLYSTITPSIPAGKKYIFLLVDDYSRFMWTYLLKRKDEAYEAFRKFCAVFKNGTYKNIMTFKIDRGREFSSKEFMSYCEDAGITSKFSTSYSPQQNGIVEMCNRTMVEMTRSFLKKMNLPCSFWGEAIRHSTYILNRLPTRAISGITPFDTWCGEKPYVGHILVFGCVAHMKVSIVNMKKLDDSV